MLTVRVEDGNLVFWTSSLVNYVDSKIVHITEDNLATIISPDGDVPSKTGMQKIIILNINISLDTNS